MSSLRNFLTARYGYIAAMLVLLVLGIVATVRAFEFPHGDDSGSPIAATIAFGVMVLASKGR